MEWRVGDERDLWSIVRDFSFLKFFFTVSIIYLKPNCILPIVCVCIQVYMTASAIFVEGMRLNIITLANMLTKK